MSPSAEPGFFICLFNGRAGSSHLFAHLESHSRLFVQHEILAGLKDSWAAQKEKLDSVYRREDFPQNTEAVGIKTKLFDIADKDAFREFLLNIDDLKVIQLERHNCVRMAISVIRARKLYDATGLSNIQSQEQMTGPIHIDPELFSKTLISRQRAYQRLDEFVSELKLPRLKLVYEDLLNDEASYLGRVFEFLGVQSEDTTSPLIKNTPQDLELAVSNLAELRERFPEYREWFD